MSNIIAPQKVLHLYQELEKKKHVFNQSNPPDFLITRKINGWYGFVDMDLIHKTKSPITSRQLKGIKSLEHYEHLFKNLMLFLSNNFPELKNIRLIFEIIIPDLPFEVMSGILNRTKGDCILPFGEVKFYFHDLVFLDKLNSPASCRLEKLNYSLNAFINYTRSDYSYSRVIKILRTLTISNNLTNISNIAERQIELGEEGIVLKAVNSPYSPGKRNSDLLKIKVEAETMMKVIELEETTGDKGNDSLQLVVEDIVGTTTKLRVGNHKDLNFIYDNNIIGKEVSMVYMMKSNKGGYVQPRLNPKFDITKL